MEKMWGFKSLMPKVKHLDNLTCLPHLLKNYSNSDSTYSRTANCMLYFACISNRKTVHFRLSTKACFLVWHPRICTSISGTSCREKFCTFFFMFMGPCIVIYFYSKTTKMHNFFLSLLNINIDIQLTKKKNCASCWFYYTNQYVYLTFWHRSFTFKF